MDVDYFCGSYQEVYRYGHERMTNMAQTLKTRRLSEYKNSGGSYPGEMIYASVGVAKSFKSAADFWRRWTRYNSTVPDSNGKRWRT